MATDNRTDQLFPDVTEHYGNDIIDMSGDVAFPVPQENYDTELPTDALYDDVVLPVVPVAPATPHDPSNVATYNEDPTDEFPVVLPVDVANTATERSSDDNYQPVGEAEPQFEYADAENAAELESDPYADAPDWVRAHIPRGPLVAEVQARRGVSARLPRRPARAAAQAADVPAKVIAAEPKTPTGGPAHETADSKKNPWLVGGAAAAVLAVVAGTVVVLASSDNSGDVAVPPLPSSTQSAENSAAGEQSWCEDSTKNGQVIGRGPGDRTTGPGLIQAFDYAYYVERDAAKVTSMYVNPNPVGPIQASIDAAAALGTEHCLTIAPTPNPNVFDVQLRLRTEAGSEGADRQRITVADSGSGLKIATLEEIR